MTAQELRKKFIEFFTERGHKELPPASLIPENDPSVLFTTAGMQQFKKYYTNSDEAPAKNIVTIQPALRTNDIEEVGDKSHFTFFEMLGNFSFGGYGKKETIKWALEFLESLGLNKKDFVGHYFEGDKISPEDSDSIKILDELEVKKQGFDRTETFWGPTGNEGPCGPSVELFFNNLEVWTLVFNEYFQDKDKKFSKLESLGVDTGVGLERLLMIVNSGDDIYKTDLFEPVIAEVEQLSGKKYEENKKAFRIIADHIRASVFLAADGIVPSNIGQGYILRRLIRRSIRYWKLIGEGPVVANLATEVIENYKEFYPHLEEKEQEIISVLQQEEEKFAKTLEAGLKMFKRRLGGFGSVAFGKGQPSNEDRKLSGEDLFNLYQTYGFPIELSVEIANKEGSGMKIDAMEIFAKKLKEHQEKSRTASAGMFKSGLVATSETTTKYHTATHLLLAALRQVLGNHVVQKGSNITEERLRLDFSHPERLTPEQMREVENIVNGQIKEDLQVNMEVMSLEDAKDCGAMGVFEKKYGIDVKVYSMGEFSKEICAGPHVEHTGVLGNFKIIKEESSSAGVRRIKAVLE